MVNSDMGSESNRGALDWGTFPKAESKDLSVQAIFFTVAPDLK